MTAFRAAMRGLEQTLGGSLLGSAVAGAASLADQLDVVAAFAGVTAREGFRWERGRVGGWEGVWVNGCVGGVVAPRCLPLQTFRLHAAGGCRKAVEARISDWHLALMQELDASKALFECVKAALPPGFLPLPPCAGKVLLARGLLRRIERTWEHLVALGPLLPPASPRAAESAAAYEALHCGLQQYVNAVNMQVGKGGVDGSGDDEVLMLPCPRADSLTHSIFASPVAWTAIQLLQWYASVPPDLISHMQGSTLLRRQDPHAVVVPQPAAPGNGAADAAPTPGLALLQVNLSPQLHDALEEARCFEAQRLGVPAIASELLSERQRLRSLAVGAGAVCQAYNALLGSGLSAEDRRLCRDRIRFVFFRCEGNVSLYVREHALGAGAWSLEVGGCRE